MNHFLFGVVLAIPMVNDFFYAVLMDRDPKIIYIADTLFRICILLILWYLVKVKFFKPFEFKLNWYPRHNIFAVISFLIIGAMSYNFGEAIAQSLKLNWDPKMFQFREINYPYKLFDLTIGVFLVAFTEEIIYRALLIRWVEKTFKLVEWKACLISIIVFGLGHWGNGGLEHIIATSLYAIPLTFATYYSKAIWPLIIAHYIYDVIIFI